MKKLISVLSAVCIPAALAFSVSAASTASETAPALSSMKSALIFMAVISAVMILFCVIFTALTVKYQKTRSGRRRRSAMRSQKTILNLSYCAAIIILVCTSVCFFRYRSIEKAQIRTDPSAESSAPPLSSGMSESSVPETSETLPAPTEPPEPTLTPAFVEKTNPENWGINWEIIDHGSIVDSYQRAEPIKFGKPEDYFALPGLATFRGDNYRTGATYGTAEVKEGTLNKSWTANIGSLNGWPGSGWTGQPLIVQWDEETKQIMNLYSDKKAKKDLVEVIYATLDGYVYFYDLDDGSYTRDKVYLGMNFKGAGSLDPRGYPLMYVGSGDTINGTSPRMYIVSLIDGSILYKKSGSDAFAQRSWVAFDSSPLVDAKTDTLIWPGESGILYTIKLNTTYDKAAGTLSINPEETVKTRYTTKRYTRDRYWIGYEPSAVIVDRYLFTSENGGMFFCIDLDTMELVWAQDTKDDSNSTPAFQWEEDGNGYLYTAPSLHWTAKDGSGKISIYKLNAATGEIVWEVPFDCHTVPGVSGGVQSTPLLGKPGTELEGMIFYTIARTPNVSDGKFVAFDTKTGEIIWEKYMDRYAWSSPVAIYGEDGSAHIVIADSVGNMSLLNAKGEILSTIGLGSNIEASPAVFKDTLVVGTRGQLICGIKVK